MKENAKWKTENKVNEKVDRAIDDVLDGKLFKKKSKAKPDSATTPASAAPASSEAIINSGRQQDGASLKAYSKFDFVPGDKVLYYDDFERVAVGDFPAEYNTDASGEVMTVEGRPGKWLGLNANGSFLPEPIGILPDNFT
ncbi:MAG: hypothetical protein MUF62_12035, partial [Chitinophagaceae bacterium]|nr:hypothetical protein [Chitinophagaceae bacterium]